jgi:CDP-diacylglycerol pyrophosphatase
MKIRINKKVWLIVGIIIFAIVFGNLVSIYVQEAREQGALRTNVATQQALLHKLTTEGPVPCICREH